MEVLENFLILGTPSEAMERSRKIGKWMCAREMRLFPCLLAGGEGERLGAGGTPGLNTMLICHACLPRIQPRSGAAGDRDRAGPSLWGR